MLGQVSRELRHHAPFTLFGAVTGIAVMLASYSIPFQASYTIFYVLHPIHILLSAIVTSSMYKLHARGKSGLWLVVPIGYAGSVGIATLSDSIIPYWGEALLNLPNRGVHLGFIEEYWLVNPLALVGVGFAYLRPTTKFPHAGHVLLSTWASLFHIIMALGGSIEWILLIPVFLFLFVAVWLPCCLSDIVFPLLFVKKET
jgi:hypothetical protein